MTTALLHRGSRFGDLRLTGYVGSGGFSDVYEAFDKSGRRLAIKVLRLTGLDSDGQQQRIEREREALSRIGSRGVAKLLHSDLQCDTPWIASEFVDGPTLQEIVAASGPLSRDEGLSLVRRLAEILDELHQEGIAHRDLSPNNIIIGPDGPVIIDFGSARIDLEGGATGSLLLAGTGGFVPPEALRGEPVGKAGDIFALGKIAEFVLGATSKSETLLGQTLSEWPNKRPSAHQLAADLAQFGLVVTRTRRRAITKLARRFRARSLIAASVLVIAPTSYLTSLVVGDGSALETKALFDTYDKVATANWSDGLFSLERIPSDWIVERIRPIDSVFGYRTTDLDAIQVRSGDVEKMDVTKGYVYGQIKVSSITHYRSASQAPSSAELVQQLFDQTIDIFEVGYLPNGCSMDRAEVPLALSESTSLLAASAPACAALNGETILAGVLIDIESNLMAEWYIDSTVRGAESIFPLRVGLPVTSPVVELLGPRDLSSVTKLKDATARVAWLKSASDFLTYEWGSVGLILEPGEGVQFVGKPETDAQLSFYVIDPIDDLGEGPPVSAGRWWTRPAGESTVVINPFPKRTFLFVEAEGFDDSPINVEMQPVKGVAALEVLRRSLGVEFEPHIQFDNTDEKARFSLPSPSAESPAKPIYDAPFFFGALDLSYPAELSGSSFGFTDLTVITRADKTQTASEIGALETHDPHFLMYYAPAVDLAREEETSTWVSFGRPTNCLYNVEWEIGAEMATLLIDAYLGCRIDDAEYSSAASTVPQANVFFRFALIDEDTESSILGGSFSPASWDDLERFRTFLQGLKSRSGEIVGHFQTLQGS